MNYVKSCLIITMLLGVQIGYSQCDANGDGDLDVLDVVIEVNCILTDCWEGSDTTQVDVCVGLERVPLWGVDYFIATTTEINLGSQGLTGSIPPEIGCLTNLTYLNLALNELSGEIPSEIGNLTNLTILGLGWNQLTGDIPPEIGNLTNLTGLALDSNQLTGDIPSEIGNLTSLTWLSLWNNQLTGEIPPEVCDLMDNFSSWWNIENYILSGNNLINTCEEPSICDGLTEVELWGEFYPIDMSQSPYYGELILWVQGLSGSIPPEIGCLTNLTYLNLSDNQLTGSIPPEIGNLTNLTQLYLHTNQLTGEIPPEIGNLTNLTDLGLSHNQLTGEIPSEIGNLTNLNGLSLHNNQLTGEIPPEIGQLTSLEWLSLSGNQLTGEIPSEVCDLIESNNLDMDLILWGNNLINTCD